MEIFIVSHQLTDDSSSLFKEEETIDNVSLSSSDLVSDFALCMFNHFCIDSSECA